MPTFGTTVRLFGGYTLDRDVIRQLQADDKWYVYAAGAVDPGDANTATISLVYQKDDESTVSLGSVTKAGAGWAKKKLGPFDVFGTAGVPLDEDVPMIRLAAIKDAGVDGEIDGWTLWVRHLPAKG